MEKQKKGFTILELLFSITIFSFIMIGMGNILISFYNSFDYTQKINYIFEDINETLIDVSKFQYNTGIIIDSTLNYKSLFLYNSNQGLLLGVFDDNSIGTEFLLSKNIGIIEKKYLGYFYIDDLSLILDNLDNIGEIKFKKGYIKKNILLYNLDILSLNIDKIFELQIDIFLYNNNSYFGKIKNETTIPSDYIKSLNLNF